MWLLLCVIAQPLLAVADETSVWHQFETSSCLAESLAERKIEESLIDVVQCLMLAKRSGASGLAVIQFNSDSRRCHAFRLRFVCHLVEEAKGSPSLSHKCTVFATARALAFLRLSRRLSAAMGPGLRGAWAMGEDEEASRTNLVCGETQLWQAKAVQWTDEGARFDGNSSYMTMKDLVFAEQFNELSVLVRVKRQITSKSMPLLERYDCSNTVSDFSLWDAVLDKRGAYLWRTYSSMYKHFSSHPSTNTIEPSVWAEFGAISPDKDTVNFVSNGGLVSPNKEKTGALDEQFGLQFHCLILGATPAGNRLNGLVQAASYANASLTLAQINGFYDIVRGFG